MLRILGMLLIFLSLSGTGFLLSFLLTEKRQRLILIKKLINEIINDLSFKKTPLPSFFEKIKNERCYDKLAFLKSIENDNLRPDINSDKRLSEEEKNILTELFEIVGSTVSNTQINLLEDLKLRTEMMIEKTSEECREKGKIFIIGGVLSGLFFIILIA